MHCCASMAAPSVFIMLLTVTNINNTNTFLHVHGNSDYMNMS